MARNTNAHPRTVRLRFAAPAVASGSDLTTMALRVPCDGTVESVSWVPLSTVTGADTNTRKQELYNRGAAGSGTTQIALLQYNSGVNATAKVAKTITLNATAANLEVSEGDILDWVSTHVGTGVADPAGFVEVVIQAGRISTD